ncbi:MAG: MBL fold metallo-hydrolase [Pseudomonadota bacterium]
MKVIFLGTNGWYDTPTGNTICTLIRAERHDIILDAGIGFYKINHYIPVGDEKPATLLLSHFHLDHIYGLHMLVKGRFPHGLTLCGPAGTRQIIDVIVNSPFTVSLERLPFTTTIYEVPEDNGRLSFSLDAKPLLHSGVTLGYRIHIDGKTIAYCPDTGYCENAVALSLNADLLIIECAYKSGETDESWPHLNPETAARIAVEAGARKLVLTHFTAGTYLTLAERKVSEGVAQMIFPDTLAAMDGATVD